MKAVCLLGVFILAKVLILAGREIPLSPWTPLAYLWQDLAVVLVFAILDGWLSRRWPRIGWWLYAVLVLYSAVNVPVACQLSTPLTWPLLRATRGALADSILHHVTTANVLRMGVLLTVAAALPALLRHFPRPMSPRGR